MLLLLVLSVVGVSRAQHYCCGPAQWEANMAQLEGYYNPQSHDAGLIQGVDRVSFDYLNKRLTTKVMLTSNGHPIPTITIYNDYTKGIQYKVQNNNCTSSVIATAMPGNCIPKVANFTGSTYFGVGRDKLMLDAWKFEYPSGRLFLTTTQNGCYPVTEGIVGEFNSLETIAQCKENCVDAIIAYGITGLTVGIADQSVFEVPELCQTPNSHESIQGVGLSHISRELRKRHAQI